MKGKQSWVTSASDDDEGIKALILARSLRNVITRRLLTIFISFRVSEEIRVRLQECFDSCIILDKKQLNEYDGLPFSTVAKINCWSLYNLRKFVFLDCNSVVLINSDELFKEQGFSLTRDEFNDPLMIADATSKLQFIKFLDVIKLFSSTNGVDNLPILFNEGGLLDTKYNVPMDLQGENLEINLSELKIVWFSKTHLIEILKDKKTAGSLNLGIIEQALFDKTVDLLKSDTIYLSKSIPELLKETLNGNNNESVNLNTLKEMDDSVAIVGLSFRLAGANNLDEFWDLLINGKEGIIPVPEGRWEEDIRTETIDKSKQAGFLNCPIGEIDAKFFGLSPMEVSFTDPQQRLTLQVMWEAFEHAGINPNSLKNSKTGVFGGWWRNEYKDELQQGGINEQEFFRTYMGNSLGTLTGRISHVLELTGPSIPTESACSTSIVAVDMACKSLLNEDCDVGLAFGVNLLLHPFSPQILNSIISPDGRCKTFDAKADGFGRAEGCTVLVLKRYSDAIRDGNRVWGLIRGSAVVQEGLSRSLGTPTVHCEALAMQLALEDAGVEAKDVSFVETHGTGTPIGDPLEFAAMAKMYSKERENDLVIGSVKTNIGHTESCSGIAGIIKTLLALKHNAIPPHRNFETLNPEINLEQIPALIPMTPYKWEKNSNGKPRLAGVSSFGITGTDAHVIIQETPELNVHSGLKLHSEMPLHLLKISAKSPEALKDLQIKYKTFLENTKESLADICYTANTGRADFSHRSVILGSEKREMIKNLEKTSSDLSVQRPKLCFLFTGQGSQYPGMAKALYDHSPVFRMHFDNSDKILSRVLGISIKNALWGDKTQDLGLTIYSQTSIFCVEYCLLKLWESWGIKPDFVLGHSLGEFAAAVAAGILTFSDALTLVAERSRLINSLPTGKMLVVKECQEIVDVLLKTAFTGTTGYLDYAAINSAEQTVLAGSEENVLKFAELLKKKDIKTHVLQSTHAFHSRQMEPMLEEYSKTASKINYGLQKNCSFISGMDGNIKEVGEVEADYWLRHTREPVRFLKASKSVLEIGETISFLEIGPHPILCAMILSNADTLGITQSLSCLPSMRKNDSDWCMILNSLGTLYKQGVEINWKNFHQFSAARVVTLPFYSFQNKKFCFNVTKGGNQKSIHPLVGTPLPNASQLKLFQNELSISNDPYLKDHVIGNTIIMPDAGFLEMCLVAGQAAHQGTEGGYIFPSSSVTIQDFIIEGPLALNENETTLIQSVVTTDDSTGETRVTIYSKLVLDKETHKWIRHATGIFCPYGVQEPKLRDTLDQIKSRCSEKLNTHTTYNKFSEFGLKFGSTFRNLVIGYQGISDVYFQVSQPSDLNTDEYILHPVILDAIFQTIMINSDTNQLQVPISIKQLIWHAKLTTQTSYVHLYKTKHLDEEQVATLYDENGLRIVTLIGVGFKPTNVSTVMLAIEGQKKSLPSMYQQVWRDQLGPWERRMSNLSLFDEIDSDHFKDPFRYLSKDQEDYYDIANELCSLYIVRLFSQLGWNYKIGQKSSLKTLLSTLAIPAIFKRFTRYMLTVLMEDGYLKDTSIEDDDYFAFKVIRNFPSGDVLSSDIEKLQFSLNPIVNRGFISVQAVAEKLYQILSGKQSALPILFPVNPNEFQPLEQYYKNCNAIQHCYEAVTEVCIEPMKILASSLSNTKAVCRILEIGAGTGSLTSHVLKHLTGPASGYEYTYTDITPVFFSSGEKMFQNSEIRVVYKTLNIEIDSTLQGFIPHYYDIIYASFVVHATKNIRKSLVNLRNLLRPGGTLLLTELTKPLRETNLTVGVLEGFWVFEDYDLRPSNCEMSGDKWKKVLKSSGFSSTAVFPVYNDHTALIISTASDNGLGYIKDYLTIKTISRTWVVFSNHIESTKIIETELSQIGRHVVLVNSSAEKHLSTSTHYKLNLNKRSQPLLEMQTLFKDLFTNSKTTLSLEGVIYIANQDTNIENNTEFNCQEYLYLCQTLVGMNNIKLFVLTRGTLSLDDNHKVTSPFPGSLIGMTKGLQNENTTLICRNIDMDPSCSLLEGINDAFTELFVQDGECVVAYRGNQRKVSRLIPPKTVSNSLKLPRDRFNLILPTSNDIQDLRFGPDITHELGNDDVEIQVRSCSLNFRDVLVILKPTSEFQDFNSVGLDFSGVVTAIGSEVSLYKIGDAVVGINLYQKALPSHIVTNERLVLPMQQDMTFNEAATLPVVSLTIYLCFFKGKKLRKNDTILIHTGSGGVGLYAIQVAKIFNCTIIATAGSTRKRSYLRSLGVKHVFNSRNTEYGPQIREALGGQGVDFVLNSLTGVGFKEATLTVCNPGAKFIEISKLNVWTLEEVKQLRPDVYYEIVDASVVPILQAVEYMEEMRQIDPSINKPLPYVRFDAADIRDALNYLQKAKHIGKIICVMPELIGLKGSHEMIMTLFNDRSSYLITGGLGGIGIEIAKWMTQRGAKNIILVGRNVPGKKASEEIEIMRSNGKNIHVKQCDVSDFSQCQTLLEYLKGSVPTLRGIMHAAGVFSDGTFEKQTWEKYELVFNPKIRGGWNLHLLTLDYRLEHFVMFSGSAAHSGGLGQSNHAAANMFLDCLAHYRNYMGLPASTINWGQWGQVGQVVNMDVIGLKPMSTLQCVSALEKLMKMNHIQSCVCEADFSIMRKMFSITKKILSEFQDIKDTSDGTKVNSDDFWAEYNNSRDAESCIQVVKKYISSVIRLILKIDENESLEVQVHFQDMGMDSLMMIEMKNSLQYIVGDRVQITMSSVKECSTIAQLTTCIVQLISRANELPLLNRKKLTELIWEDATLSADIKPCYSKDACSKPSQIRTVLITEVSGNLGPYILQEILKRPQIEKIYCLMQGSVTESAESRLRAILSQKKMEYSSLIECIDGNVIQTNFGIENKKYVKLCEEVDAVFHLAVKSTLQEQYQKLPESDRDIRTVNVLGTKNVLEFACAGKPKIVYHSSSFVAIPKLDEDKRMAEDWPKIDECEKLHNDAYTISKFIGDILMAQAVERGIPCKVFRFPFIGGDSKTGGNVVYNSLLLRMISYMHLGVMPAVPFPFMILPVDVCAELSCRIFFNDETGWEVYNIHNPRVNDEQDFIDIFQEFCYKVDLVPTEKFVEKVKHEKNSEWLLILKKAVENLNQVVKLVEGHTFVLAEAWITGEKKAFLSKKLERLIPEYPECMESGLDILKRDLLYAKNSGIFDKLGV